MAFSSHGRRDRWSVLGLLIVLGMMVFFRPVARSIDDTLVRFMLLPMFVAAFAGAMVLMFFKGPDPRD
jgi:hypothetical protein